MAELTDAQRIIIAADFKPDLTIGDRTYRQWTGGNKFWNLLKQIDGLGVTIKVNTMLRLIGYPLLEQMKDKGFSTFADLKLNDIPETLANDGAWLRACKPDFVTVMCNTGVDAMKRLKDELPDTRVLGVTVLTSLTDTDAYAIYHYPVDLAAHHLAEIGKAAGIDGFVCSAAEVETLRTEFGPGHLIVTPGIRFQDVAVKGDDQNQERVTTPAFARQAGADAIVMGRPITQAPDPRAAALRAIQEFMEGEIVVEF